jgi:hypothetical protein
MSCLALRLPWTAPSRSRLGSEPRASASGFGIAPNLAVDSDAQRPLDADLPLRLPEPAL